VSSIGQILLLISQRDDAGTVEVNDTLLFRALVTSPTTDPSTGALDALISSGRIALLTDVELRRFLAGFRTRVEDVREDELGARSVAHEKLFPLFTTVSACEAAAAIPLDPVERAEVVDKSSRIAFDDERWTRIRANLSLRRFWLQAAIFEGNQFLVAMDSAQVLMREEVAEFR
jgi:hypothetical protein